MNLNMDRGMNANTVTDRDTHTDTDMDMDKDMAIDTGEDWCFKRAEVNSPLRLVRLYL